MTAAAVVAAGRGRPLRFLGTVMGGWVALRIAMLWPQDVSPATVPRALAPVSIAVAQVPATISRVAIPLPSRSRSISPRWQCALALDRRPAAGSSRVALALAGLARSGQAEPAAEPPPLLPGLARAISPDRSPHPPSRWSGSAWLVARGGAGIAPGGLGGQLGGSQAGARLAFLLDRTHRLALASRVSTPLGPGLREAAIGVEWQPTRLPVRLIAEQRFAVGGGQGGPALGIVGGIGPALLPLGFRLEAYGQAGIVRRTRNEPYADGAARIAHPLGRIGALRLDLGAGAWGGAQRGAARVDVGPSFGLAAPIGTRMVRLSFDWRQRVAGDAHPDSGPALTLGADF